MFLWLMLACDGGNDTSSDEADLADCPDQVSLVEVSYTLTWDGDSFDGYDFSEPIEGLNQGVYRFRPCVGSEDGTDCDVYSAVYAGARLADGRLNPFKDLVSGIEEEFEVESWVLDLVHVPDEFAHCAERHLVRFELACDGEGDELVVDEIPQAQHWLVEDSYGLPESEIWVPRTFTSDEYQQTGTDGSIPGVGCPITTGRRHLVSVLSADAVY